MKKNNQSFIGKLIFIVCIFIFLYALLNSIGGDYILRKHGSCIVAHINRKTYGGKTKPKLGYLFMYNGKTYDGLIAEDGFLNIGDTICVVYLENFPNINRPFSYFDSGEIKCNCIK